MLVKCLIGYNSCIYHHLYIFFKIPNFTIFSLLSYQSCCRRWQSSAWGPCSRTCDLGEQVKDVYCVAVMGNNSTRRVDDDQCYKQYQTKPEYRRSCNDGVSCSTDRDTAMWIHSAWGQVALLLLLQ